MRLVTELVGVCVLVYSVESGLWLGVLKDAEGTSVLLSQARRVWEWTGAASRSQLATDGPEGGRMPAPVEGDSVILGVCEILPVTEEAVYQFRRIPAWSA